MQKPEPHAKYVDPITDEHLRGIGRVITRWAMTERVVMDSLWEIAIHSSVPLPAPEQFPAPAHRAEGGHTIPKGSPAATQYPVRYTTTNGETEGESSGGEQ